MVSLKLDFDLYASRQIQSHKSLYGVLACAGDVDQSLVGAALELLTG